MNRRQTCILLIFVATFFWPQGLNTGPQKKGAVHASIISEVSSIKPGESFKLGLRFKIEKDWHIYWKSPGDAGLATSVLWKKPKGIHLSELGWPKPSVFKEVGNMTTYGYENEVVLISKVEVSPHWKEGAPIDVSAKANWLACKTLCVPGGSDLTLRIPTSSPTIPNRLGSLLLQKFSRQIPNESEEQKILNQSKKKIAPQDFLNSLGPGKKGASLSFWAALALAFLGGLVLNIMPCVLPVLSLKALRLIKHTESSHKEIRLESLCFFAGLLFSFLGLAVIVVLLKTAGQEIGWGFQFQEPRFLILFSALLVGLSLSLFGAYDLMVVLPAEVTKLTKQKGWWGPFWEGALATILATPCSAPFLGPALGFAFTQNALITVVFFLTIGTGLALPYLLLALYPPWIRFLPKPGPWMNVFKKLMGAPVLGTALWLLWILERQTGSKTLLTTLLFIGGVSLGFLAVGKWASPLNSRSTRWFVRLLTLALLAICYQVAVEPSIPDSSVRTSHREGNWQPFSLASLEEALTQGQTVFVDFTADWCLTCQVNKKTVLHKPSLEKAFEEKNIVLFRADWTNRHPEITQVLKQLGRSGVPVYVLFRKGEAGNPIYLPEILTERILLDAIQKS